MDGFTLTTHRVMNRRGVLWLGQTCNLRCYFCYFLDRIETKAHAEHPFMTLAKAKTICRTLVDYYGNNSIDIQGGEPTIWGDIHDLVSYCAGIGLKPTLISNGIVLSKDGACQRLKDAGVYDILLSVQGLGSVYDEIVGLPGGSARQMTALENLRAARVPFRFNTVLSKPVLPQLEVVTRLGIESGSRVMNFIAFNPFIDQTCGRRSAKNVASYGEIMPHLTPVLDTLDAAGVEVNVRYLPFCVFEARHRRFCQNFPQIVYDLHEWDAASEGWTSLPGLRQAALPLQPPISLQETVWRRRLLLLDSRLRASRGRFGRRAAKLSSSMRGAARELLRHIHQPPLSSDTGPWGPAERPHGLDLIGLSAGLERGWQAIREKLMGYAPLPGIEALHRESRMLMPKVVHPYTKPAECAACTLSPICDGFHKDYVEMFGADECRRVAGPGRITDPKWFIGSQRKVVEEQEYDWALPAEQRPSQ
jgi:pyruvate-formate lyase-activating enzyme